MPVDIDSQEGHIIRKMVPFSTMPSSIFKVICDKITLETARSGTFLFKRGDTKKELVYLLKGEVSLEVDKLKMEVIKAGTESARFALAHQLPRKVNGVAKGTVQFLRLNSIYITTPDAAQLKKQDAPPAAIKEDHASGNQNWMSTLLMVPVFRALPPTQLSKINDHLEEVRYEEGDVIVRQGEKAGYFYLIKSGDCVLSYKDKDAAPEQNTALTKLTKWDSFGAEALISDKAQNPAATALNSASLLRINKEKFLALIKQPLLRYVDEVETEVVLRNGGVLLDVRSAPKDEMSPLVDAINIPLPELRNSLKKLESNHPMVVISDERGLSEAAAFLLLSYKFSACVSKKDIEKTPSHLSINIRQPVTHRFAAAGATNGDDIVLDLLTDDAEQEQNDKMVITTRSVPKHVSPPDVLAAENAGLRQQLEDLKLRLAKVEQDKQEIGQKYQVLLKQSERLKSMLQSLKK